ncbi:MAG TPA: ShlB/FhaC/HecB family hemolysin secretion/activation protein [Candidatus Omnitrophota bacterium]|nr:ShlB/FhaC/HecB family hemolysin secretion/activation protein [Candidatus Omnitrophota bacterium]HQQ06384.1 ShlB/FhaC/HecB family hemolysin secretion/activation protein [Candidatus Omnitrophota bacterium]
MRNPVLAAVVCLSVLFPSFVIAQVEKVQTGERQVEEEKLMRERIEAEQEQPQIEEPAAAQPLPASREQKAFVRGINVSRVTLLNYEQIARITAPFENRELTLADMQKVADLITDAYRRRGYVTSRAYLPPQKIVEGILEIMAVEGTVGDISIKGNRYFKTALIEKRISLHKGDLFNYTELRRGLARLNEHPDRNVKAVLSPGKETGTSDIMLDVADDLPIHVRFDYDNYGSRYVGKDRFSGTVSHNNAFGLDDMLSLQYQLGESEDYRLISMRYLVPLSDRTRIGAVASRSKLSLGQEYADLDARGKSKIYGIFLTHELLNRQDLTLTFNTGFDYLDSYNFQAGAEQSRDRMRVVKFGLDADYSDSWMGGGRTIFSPEAHIGIPNIFGGMDDTDARCSRAGAGGRFLKFPANLLRLQKMPFSSALLWKNSFQLSSYPLAASQQFQVGGISNVRGYPSGEYVGDQGLASTFEWLLPLSFIPKDLQVPLSKAKFYDAFRVALFYDWGWARLKQPQAGERKSDTLRSAGFGMRFNLPESFSVRADLAWPLDRTPSDDDHMHPWIAVSKEF